MNLTENREIAGRVMVAIDAWVDGDSAYGISVLTDLVDDLNEQAAYLKAVVTREGGAVGDL